MSDQTVCMDDRMLTAQGTGVKTYAQALRTAQSTISRDALLLTAGAGHTIAPSIARRAKRSLRATLQSQTADRSGREIFCEDVFGLSHAYFTLHRELLPIRVPGRPGIMHWTYPLPARLVGWTNLYTVHDLIPFSHPDLTPIDPHRHRRILAAIARAAGGFITVSDASRAELAHHPTTASVATWNCSQPVESLADHPDIRLLPAGLMPDGYLLVCGAVEPRKNVARIAEAYRRSELNIPLVIAGPDGWRAETLRPLLSEQDGIVRLAYQPRETILALIAHARCLIFPSLAEGFGLPAIEAMALGTPVLTSRRGALGEVAADAAYLIEPEDIDAISTGLRRLASDDQLRHLLAERGRSRARDFTAEAFASRLDTAYAEAAALSRHARPCQ